jgi:hypothetical protein
MNVAILSWGPGMGETTMEWYRTKMCPILLHVFGVSKLFDVNLLGYIMTIERFKCK